MAIDVFPRLVTFVEYCPGKGEQQGLVRADHRRGRFTHGSNHSVLARAQNWGIV